MTARILRFPPRHLAAVWILPLRDSGWLVLARDHGWIHGDRRAALRDARWLAWNLGLPMREAL
jgi:hypothetical protein